MNENLSQVTGCATGLSCFGVGIFKWFDAVAVPEFLLWGGAILLVWQLWRAFFPKRNRSDDGTHY